MALGSWRVGSWKLLSASPDVLDGAVDCSGHVLGVPAVREQRNAILSVHFHLRHRQASSKRHRLADAHRLIPPLEFRRRARQMIRPIEKRTESAGRRLRELARCERERPRGAEDAYAREPG